MTNTEQATFIAIPESAPTAYYEGWTTGSCGHITLDGMVPCVIVATKRTGETGRSDAQYVVDRLASGLYFGRIIEPEVRPRPNVPWSETIRTVAYHATEPTPAEVHDAAPEARGMVEVTEGSPGDHLGYEDLNEDGEPLLSDLEDPSDDEDVARRLRLL